MQKVADLHVDVMNRSLERGWDIMTGEADAHVDIPRLLASNVRCLGVSLWTGPGEDALDRTRRQLDATTTLVEKHPDKFRIITDRDALVSLETDDRVGFLVHVEGAHGVADSLAVMEEFVARGVRGLTLTWNNTNALADSCVEPRSPAGLTDLGREFVAALGRWGCVVDLSHVSKTTFWNALEMAPDRCWVSHAGCEALAKHPRNLDDDQIRALAEAGSVIGVIAFPLFLNPSDPQSVTLDTVADHVDHAASIGGPDSVALGTDFDGIPFLPKGMSGIEDLPKLFDILSRRGWTDDEIERLCWKNPTRVLRHTLVPAS